MGAFSIRQRYSNMQTHPKWKYSVDGSVMVADEAEEAALGEGWYDFPELVPADAEETARDVESLRATAATLNITVDKRWGVQRLEDEIKAKIEADGQQDHDSLV